MEQLLPESWVYMHFALILIITCLQMLVIYVLGDSSNPPAGLGMYTVYFMASLLGWIAFTLQQGSGITVTVDVPSIAAIINSYILYLAAGQRSGITHGRVILGVICLLAVLSGLVLQREQMFIVQISATTLFFVASGLLCAWHCHRNRNIGDGIISIAAFVMCAGLGLALYYLLGEENQDLANVFALGSYSVAYVLVTIGFLACVLIEYQGHLADLATNDPLTRLFNKKGMTEALQLTLAAARRRESPVSVMLIDIDHFTEINDTFGAEFGDQVIRAIADILKRMSRASDVVARVGGEKFLLVLPDTDLQASKVLAERIRSTIGESPLPVEQQVIPVTASIGVTSARDGLVDLDHLSQEAENAMLLAKQGGRNRVASIDHNPVHLTSRRA